jgi:hypothetical protein
MMTSKAAGTLLALVWAVGLGVEIAAQARPVLTFDDEKGGAAPAGFTFVAMRQQAPGTWLVRRTGANGYLLHEPGSRDSSEGYSIGLAPGDPLRDLQVSVRVRLAGGSLVGGLVWRYQDEHNHYQILLDLTRRELAMYRVVAGNRIRVEREDGLELDPAAWHTLKIVHEQSEIRVSLGGIRVFEENDRTFGAGRAGVVAGGIADVWFDDLRIEAERRGR